MNFEILNWDSDFFGFKTARIQAPRLTSGQLTDILSEARGEHVRLAYWAAVEEAAYDIHALGGLLVDKKVTFEAKLDPSMAGVPDAVHPVVKYHTDIPMEIMTNLAEQAGKYSRFARDPHFPRDRFIALYREWIRKSLTREMADEVLLAIPQDIPAGMVTVSARENWGEIGLIAVDAAFRSRHLGEALVRAAQRWYLERGLKLARVVTQADNQPACRLYQKCGYEISSTEYFYHFWL